MRSPSDLHSYQQKAVEFQCTNPYSALWLDMGLGKSVITLTSINYLLNVGFLRGIFIVAPVRVCRLVWRQEALKWSHLNHLKFSMVVGTRDQRTRALLQPAHVYLINYENLGWLAETLNEHFIKKNKPLPANGIVYDEISKCKNSTTNRVKSLMKILDHFVWRTGLTGTPAANGYKDLHGQYLVLDGGQRLGKSKTQFSTKYYRKIGPYKEVPYDDTEVTMKNAIGDMTLEMSAEDYNKLPDMIVNDVEVELPDLLRGMYDQMEREFFLQLDSGENIEVFNQAALTNKCLQFANGAMYPEPGNPEYAEIHDLKLEALEDIIEESAGQPILCSYAYRSDAERIMRRFADLRPINLTECKSESSLQNAMHRWKSGDCQLMIGHPACLGSNVEVLTEFRGWQKIINVGLTDRVFDGIEFVGHLGCSYSGYKEVIDVVGITMTPNHKLLIDNVWTEAKNVRDCAEVRDEALRLGDQAKNYCVSEVFELRSNYDNASSKRDEEQSRRSEILQHLCRNNIPSFDKHEDLENLVRIEVESERYERQELRGSWNKCMRRMARKFSEILRGYVKRVLGRPDHRKNRREQTLQQGKLQVGYEHGAATQQAQQQIYLVQGRIVAFGGIGEEVGILKDDVDNAIEPRNECRRSGPRLSELSIWEEQEIEECTQTRKAHVYDLVNCGPRHRFVIRNSLGEVFISHNSMGHGIDGLQDRGHTLVWFGLNWSLDLYEQFNARIRRQGQGVPVICHRILCKDTLDHAQALALDQKAHTQSALRSAIKDYRASKEKLI